MSGSFSPYAPGRGGRPEFDAERLFLAHAAAVAGQPEVACGHAFARAADAGLLADRIDFAADAGKAPGPDRVRLAEFDRLERQTLARRLSDLMSSSVDADGYRTGPMRPVTIAKLAGGERTLHVPNHVDTVVHGALADAVRAAGGSTLSGFDGPHRGPLVALAAARSAARSAAENGGAVLTFDIANCFPSLPRHGVREALSDAGVVGELHGLVDRTTGGMPGPGLPQGSPLSPVCCDALLSRRLDGPLAAEGASVVRYADDVLAVCEDAAHAQHVLKSATDLLKSAGFGDSPLKPSSVRVIPLGGDEEFEWLGYRLAAGPSGLRPVGVTDAAYASLEDTLGTLDEDQAGPGVLGFFHRLGTVRDLDVAAVRARVLEIAAVGTPNVKDCRTAWREGGQRWAVVERLWRDAGANATDATLGEAGDVRIAVAAEKPADREAGRFAWGWRRQAGPAAPAAAGGSWSNPQGGDDEKSLNRALLAAVADALDALPTTKQFSTKDRWSVDLIGVDHLRTVVAGRADRHANSELKTRIDRFAVKNGLSVNGAVSR